MFRRSKSDDSTAVRTADLDADADGKGRATPSRKQAEAERRERLKASARGTATKSSSGRASRSSSGGSGARADRVDARKRMMAGDESALAARDRGPARRYARDLVDSRRSVGQYFLYLAVAVLAIDLLRSPGARIVGQVMLGVIILALVVDSLLINRAVSRAVRAKYPDEDLKGIGGYAMKRAMVTRRLRVPSPQVEIGGMKARR